MKIRTAHPPRPFVSLFSISLLLFFLLQTPSLIGKEKAKVALVIANNQYAEVGALENPVNDGRAIAKELHLLGFDVTTVLDAEKEKMESELINFLGRLRSGAIGFFYFAGHGVQINGVNYLLPIDAVAENVYKTKYSSIALNQVFDIFEESQSFPNVVVLDCCRNNPFVRGIQSRSGGNRGLVDVKAPQGTLVAFSTAAGEVAADGDKEKPGNSPYTAALVEQLRERPARGLELTEVFRRAAKTVFERTGQDPLLKIPGSVSELVLVRGTTPVEPGLTQNLSTEPAGPTPTYASVDNMAAVLERTQKMQELLDKQMRELEEERERMREKLAEAEKAKAEREEEPSGRETEEEMRNRILAEMMIASTQNQPVREQPVSRNINTGPWLFSDSDSRYLSTSEVSSMSKDQLWKARNEIFARRGYIFSSSRGKQFANSLGSSYRPVSSNQDYLVSKMNSYEKANISKIQAYE